MSHRHSMGVSCCDCFLLLLEHTEWYKKAMLVSSGLEARSLKYISLARVPLGAPGRNSFLCLLRHVEVACVPGL